MNNGMRDGIAEKAYFHYLKRVQNNIEPDEKQDWEDAEREQNIEDKIKEEAYFHYLKYGDYPLLNWLMAKNEIYQRIQFLAFYLHEADINKSPTENWKEAEKLYLKEF